MHQAYYASGFLYNPESEQILLQQHISSSLTSGWLLFENVYDENENAENVFTKTIQQILRIHIDLIYPVYSYVNDLSGKTQDVFYALCDNASFPSRKEYHFQWFSFKEIAKLQLNEQVKHDITVGKRVIEAAERKARGEHTFQ